MSEVKLLMFKGLFSLFSCKLPVHILPIFLLVVGLFHINL